MTIGEEFEDIQRRMNEIALQLGGNERPIVSFGEAMLPINEYKLEQYLDDNSPSGEMSDFTFDTRWPMTEPVLDLYGSIDDYFIISKGEGTVQVRKVVKDESSNIDLMEKINEMLKESDTPQEEG